MLTCANTMQMNATGTDELHSQQCEAPTHSPVKLLVLSFMDLKNNSDTRLFFFCNKRGFWSETRSPNNLLNSITEPNLEHPHSATG